MFQSHYNKDKIATDLDKIIENYKTMQNHYLGDHNQLIEYFNNFKALIQVYEKKLNNDANLMNNLLTIIKKAQTSILPENKLRDLAKTQAEIKLEYHQLKKLIN